jgi:hypothetical protein
MKVQVRKISKNITTNICLLPRDIYNTLNLSEEDIYKLHLGQLSVECLVKPSDIPEGYMYFTEPVFNQLLLCNNLTLNIWRKDNDIYLGPVVGMLVNTSFMRSLGKRKIPVTAIEHLQEAAPYTSSLCYCFSIKGVDWKNKRIKGYTFIPGANKWEARWFPMPYIIYDRGVNFTVEQKPIVKAIREKFKSDPEIRFINTRGTLGKWPLYNSLYKYPEVRSYLPETILYTSFDDVISMLKKHKFIFIKSSTGSRGEEVLSIKLVDNKYRIDYYDDKLKIKTLNDINGVKEHIEKFVEEKRALGRVKFIIQQGIKLLKYKGHRMDIRIHIVKNGEGKWQATNYYGIYSKGNSTITNFCVGGDFNLYENLYPEIKEQHPKITIPTQEEIGQITVKVATFIEKAFGPMGEIGMDMAIDENGRVWFFEGNARPDKYRTPGIDDMEGPSPQSVAIFEYSLYLEQNK